jgi:hypothetical protein
MKYAFRSMVVLAATLAAVPLSAQNSQSGERARAAANSTTRMPVIIPAGTPLTVAIDEDLSSASVNQGQQVAFHLPADYSEFGHVLIASGSSVRGTVSHVARRSAGGNPGSVTVSVTSVRAVDGTRTAPRAPRKSKARIVRVRQRHRRPDVRDWRNQEGPFRVIPAGTQFLSLTDTKRTVVVDR